MTPEIEQIYADRKLDQSIARHVETIADFTLAFDLTQPRARRLFHRDIADLILNVLNSK